MSMQRTWAIFTFYQDDPVLVDRWPHRAAALWAAEHLSVMRGGSYHVIEQLLPDRARVIAINEHPRRVPIAINVSTDKGSTPQM